MTVQLMDSPPVTDTILQRAEVFAKKLPQSLGLRREGRAIVLAFIIDGKPPADKDKYRRENIDMYAVRAYRKIFTGQDEIELLLRDTRLIFSTLFWDGQQLLEIEFTYFMNELIFLAAADR